MSGSGMRGRELPGLLVCLAMGAASVGCATPPCAQRAAAAKDAVALPVPAATAKPIEPSPASASAAGAPAPAPKLDDPATCADPPDPEEVAHDAWRKELEARIDGALPRLEACYRAGDARAKADDQAIIALAFDAKGAPVSQTVQASTTNRCEVTKCLKRKLAVVRAPVPTKPETFSLRLSLSPGATPRRLEAGAQPIEHADPKCAEQQPANAASALSGRLPPEEIQRVIRAHFGDFRACYEEGLARYPKLEGRTATRFVIERDGHVSHVRVVPGDLPDCKVTRCVAHAFEALEFPQPENGIVTVVYPIMLSPG